MFTNPKSRKLFIPDDEFPQRQLKVPVKYQNIDNEWTLAEHFMSSVVIAESYFGKRDNDLTFAGIEFRPNVGSPVSIPDFNNKFIIIQLGKDAFDDWSQAAFQLAHEVVHFLTTSPTNKVTNLEEGLATWFEHHYFNTYFGKGWYNPPTSGYYYDALENVKKLFQSTSNKVIFDIRQSRQTKISDITKEELMSKGCEKQVAEFLVEIFPEYRPKSATP